MDNCFGAIALSYAREACGPMGGFSLGRTLMTLTDICFCLSLGLESTCIPITFEIIWRHNSMYIQIGARTEGTSQGLKSCM